MSTSETQRADGLIEALKARLDKIERIAKACTATDWRMPDSNHVVDRDVDGWRSIPDDSRVFSAYDDREAELWHATNHDPDSVLAMVAAHREILELHKRSDEVPWYSVCDRCGTPLEYPVDWPCPTIKALAKGYGIDVES